jgi:hypothetical protein
MMSIDVDARGKLTSMRPMPVVFKYIVDGEFAVIQTTRTDKEEVRRELMTPPLCVKQSPLQDATTRASAKDYPALSLKSRHQLIYVQLVEVGQAASVSYPTLILAIRDGDPDPPIALHYQPRSTSDCAHGTLKIDVDPGFIEWVCTTFLDGVLRK